MFRKAPAIHLRAKPGPAALFTLALHPHRKVPVRASKWTNWSSLESVEPAKGLYGRMFGLDTPKVRVRGLGCGAKGPPPHSMPTGLCPTSACTHKTGCCVSCARHAHTAFLLEKIAEEVLLLSFFAISVFLFFLVRLEVELGSRVRLRLRPGWSHPQQGSHFGVPLLLTLT